MAPVIRRIRKLAAAILAAAMLFAAPPPIAAANLSGRINVNTATAAELASLPFIGPDRARDIIGLRQRQGPFSRPEDLLAAGSIGPLTLAAIRPYIKFRGKNDLRTRTALKASRAIITRPGQVMLIADQEFFPVLISLINGARKSVYCGMYLFKLGRAKSRTGRIARALAAAGRRGTRVTVLLEKSGYNDSLNEENRKTAARLRRNGITVRFDSPGVTTHVKAVVIDHRYTLLGSHNLTGSALGRNHELSLLIDDRRLASQVEDYLKTLPQ